MKNYIYFTFNIFGNFYNRKNADGIKTYTKIIKNEYDYLWYYI